MCKFNPKNDSRFLDPCMAYMLISIERIIDKKHFELVASCCGHRKYPMTIIIHAKKSNFNFELFTYKKISRKKRFYKKDKRGHYYVPEVKK